MTTIVCIGTGISLTMQQIQIARKKGFTLYGCNNTFLLASDIALLYACNLGWWQHYWKQVCDKPFEKWTTNASAAKEFGINWIAEKNAPGLSTDPNVIHHGHGSGYSLVSMAHKKGASRVLLLGYDLKFSGDYDGKARRVGSTPRHFFGEYPPQLQHWPSQQVINGVHVELVELYRSVHEQGLVEIVCCSPGSALEGVIPHMDIADA